MAQETNIYSFSFHQIYMKLPPSCFVNVVNLKTFPPPQIGLAEELWSAENLTQRTAVKHFEDKIAKGELA